MAFQFPDPNTTPEFTAANGVVYAYDTTDGKWVVKSSPFQGDYVKRTGGDTMDGPLQVMGDRANANGAESTIKAYNVDSGRDGDLQLKRNGQTKIYCSGTGMTLQGNLKMNIEASKLKSSTNTDLMTFNKNGVFYEGAYTAEKHIATKKDVDDAITLFENDVDLDNLTSITFVTNGVIKHNNDTRVTFQAANSGNSGNGLVQFERPNSTSRRGFTIRGKNTDNNDDDLLYTYTFTTAGDAVGYTGRIVNDNHITNKKYVDDKVQSVSATTFWYPLVYTRTTENMTQGYVYWANNQLIYRKNIQNQEIPKLKVGDECRLVKLEGTVIILKITQINANIGTNYAFNVLNTTPTETLGSSDAGNLFEVVFNFF